MRLLHRWIAPIAALFLTIIAVTGVYMQVDDLWSAYHSESRRVSALPTNEIANWIDASLETARRLQPQGVIAQISLAMDGDEPRLDVIWTAPDAAVLSIDPRTGNGYQPVASANADQSRYRKVARVMLQLHRGDLFGLLGRWLGLACGVALLTLGLTGLIMYVKIYRQRMKLRRWSPFW